MLRGAASLSFSIASELLLHLKLTTMSGPLKARGFGHKNKKGLALSAPAPKSSSPSGSDAQIPGGIGNDVARPDTLEIEVEFKLNLRSEDLIVLKELGSGNGGTVSKVMHAATKVVMAKKVRDLTRHIPMAGELLTETAR